MVESRTYKFTIGGVDVTSFVLKAEVLRDIGNNITNARILLNRKADTLVIFDEDNINHTVVIQRGTVTSTDNTIFQGAIYKLSNDSFNYILECKNKLQELVRAEVTKSYDKDIDASAGVISEIVDDLVTTFGGLSTTAASIQGSGSTLLLSKFICNNADVYERCEKLSQLIDWQFYYNDDDDTVYFEPRGFPSSGESLTVGTNILNVPKWEYDRKEMVNILTIKGAEDLVETTESGQIGVTTGYTTSSVVLTEKPESVKVFADSSNPPTTLRIGGSESSSNHDYEIDDINKKIVWSSNYTPGGSDYVEVRYSYRAPRPVIAKNYPSIATHGDWKKTFFLKELKFVGDIETYADGYVSKYGTPFIKTSLKVNNATEFYPGQTVTVVDNDKGINKELLITRIKLQYPYKHDEVVVEDKLLRTADWFVGVSDRIRRLEEDTSEVTDILNHVISVDRIFKPRRRYMKLQRDKIFDSFIFGHFVNGKLGMGSILENFETGAAANWTSSAGVTDSDDATTVQVGSGSLKLIFSGTGSQTITTTQSFGDVSARTGVASGTPSKGTCGVWWNSPNTTGITAIKLRIGSGASDYIECTGKEYGSVDGYINWGSLAFGLRTGWNYYLFDLDSPDSTTGTPDWTACDYARFEFTVASTHTGYLDYFTISESNFIGLNGLGDRSQTIDSAKQLIQGDMTYEEYCYDTDFHDSTNSTATFDTGNNRISFTSGQIWISEAVDVGTTLSHVTLSLGTVTGTLKLEISSDNKSTWQEVTDGTRTAVTTSDGTGTFIRITENAATTAQIDLTQDSFGQNTEPVIKLLMEE